MDNKKTIKIFKKLIANHNDRILCYELGIAETSEPKLKAMLSHFVQVSKVIKEELAHETVKAGGVPPEGAREGSKFLLAWEEVNNALKKKDLDQILKALEECEKVIVNVYENILIDHEDDFSTESQIIMIESQEKLLEMNLKDVINAKGLITRPKESIHF